MHMMIEQTIEYKYRLIYDKETNTFSESDKLSLFYHRCFKYPYGYIMESGCPPLPHFDVILIDDNFYKPGDIVEIKIIGVFKRNDNDNKFIATLSSSPITDYQELNSIVKADLDRLYPNKYEGEGYFSADVAKELFLYGEKSL